MNLKFNLIALASAVSLPALATTGITLVPGEGGSITHAMPSTKSRAEAKAPRASERSSVTADGWSWTGGDLGWVFVGTGHSDKTREAVVAEMFQARNSSPVSADGWLNIGGEAGTVYVGTRSTTPR